MHSQLFPSPLLQNPISTTFFFMLITLHTSQGQDYEQLSNCRYYLYNCGENIRNISFPFWGANRPQHCGVPRFELTCHQDNHTSIDMDSHTFRVLSINRSSHAINIARTDLWENICTNNFNDTSLDETMFRYLPGDRQLNLYYGCPSVSVVNITDRNNFTCTVNGVESVGFFADESLASSQRPNLPSCRHNMTVPVLRTSLQKFSDNQSMTLQELLREGFEVNDVYSTACMACERSDGLCQPTTNSSEGHTCLCRDGIHSIMCRHPGDEVNLNRKIIVGTVAATASALLMWLIFFIYLRRKKNLNAASVLNSRDGSSYPSITDLEKAGNYHGVNIFTYSELEEATNNFDIEKELGDGGFGTVYQGKLRDGRIVAVKRLYENNYKRVGQFMNEVEILTHLRHQNLVTLYGCTSHHCRELVLVYEYIPNGTVADHLHGEHAKPGSLTWPTRLSIAIETASALAYLHASDVIHRDVKTNNILLDNNFGVKVADFGLSRLFPTDATHVSTAPQGTPGYVDPEYHECYQLTDKSDVYSFGVVLIELISSKPAVDITRHRHEINLSNMAILKIQNHALHELVDPCFSFESDCMVREMITDVAELAFQCLQNGKEMRPSMEKVLEVLKGIQSKGYGIPEVGEIDTPADDVVLLKTKPRTPSVTSNWVSSFTTPNISE